MIKYITIEKLLSIYAGLIAVTLMILVNYFINIGFIYYINSFYSIADTFEDEKCIVHLNYANKTLNDSNTIIHYSFCFMFTLFIIHPLVEKYLGKYYEILIPVAFHLTYFYKIVCRHDFYDFNSDIYKICPRSVATAIDVIGGLYITYEIIILIIFTTLIAGFTILAFAIVVSIIGSAICNIYDRIKTYQILYYDCTPEIEDEDKNNYKNV